MTTYGPAEACREIWEWSARAWIIDDSTQRIVLGTLQRSRDTFESIVARLIPGGQVRQGMMLCRALFEDTAVIHWLVANDPNGFLVERFFDHADAMRLHEARTWSSIGRPAPDVSDIKDREQELIATFGRFAERDWWTVDAKGSRVTTAIIVDRLQEIERFGVRLKGEKPILSELFVTAQKWNSQVLHHTALGMPLIIPRDGSPPREAPDPPVRTLYIQAYWTLAQSIYLAIDVCSENDHLAFEEVFRRGLVEGFGAEL